MNLANVGRVIISAVVVIGFVAVTVLYITNKITGTANPEILSILLGALATNFTAVVNYWTGSSASSTSKDELVKDLATKNTGS